MRQRASGNVEGIDIRVRLRKCIPRVYTTSNSEDESGHDDRKVDDIRYL